MKKTTKDIAKKTKKVNRSAEDGEFVSAAEAKADPKGTVTDTVPVGKREPEASTDDGLTPEQPEPSAGLVDKGEEIPLPAGGMLSTEGIRAFRDAEGVITLDGITPDNPDFDLYIEMAEEAYQESLAEAAAEVSENVADEPLQVENPAPVVVPDPRFEDAARIAREDWEAGQDLRDADAAREAYEAEELEKARKAAAAELAAIAAAEAEEAEQSA